MVGGLAISQPGEKLPPAQSLGVAQGIAGGGGRGFAVAQQRIYMVADRGIWGELA